MKARGQRQKPLDSADAKLEFWTKGISAFNHHVHFVNTERRYLAADCESLEDTTILGSLFAVLESLWRDEQQDDILRPNVCHAMRQLAMAMIAKLVGMPGLHSLVELLGLDHLISCETVERTHHNGDLTELERHCQHDEGLALPGLVDQVDEGWLAIYKSKHSIESGAGRFRTPRGAWSGCAVQFQVGAYGAPAEVFLTSLSRRTR